MNGSEEISFNHYARLKRTFFGSSDGNPKWLEHQAEECKRRYGRFKLVPQFRSAINAFADTSAKPFELFVLGEGKFGKSTLVNALLGEERSKVRGLPETRCFLRYEITEHVDRDVYLFMRLKRGIHDWIRNLVGDGSPVPELFEVQQYTVSGRLAEKLLTEEANRMNDGQYDEPAIYEAQRFVPIDGRTAFPAGVRIVDTQGLDQLFPEDLHHLASGHSDSSAAEMFMNWMSSTTRGKHLEWQYRRCDAVLWCINAKRIGSAATGTSMKYFANYPKRIVIALTNVDLVAKSERDRQRILEAAQNKYAPFSSSIVPVNGAEALRCVLNGDQAGVRDSGLAELTDVLFDACVSGGAMTRSQSRYLGLRETESQFRHALTQMRSKLVDLKRKHEADLRSVSQTQSQSKADFIVWVNSESVKLVSAVHSRIKLIDLSDDSFSAKIKLQVDENADRLTINAQKEFRSLVRDRAQSLAASITPYSVPQFDSEGNVCGHLKKVQADPQIKQAPKLNLSFHFYLQNDIFLRATLWFRKEIIGLFSAEAKQRAELEERQAIDDRQRVIQSEFDRSWIQAKEAWSERLAEATVKLFDPIISEINRVLAEVEKIEGESVAQSCDRITEALSRRGANNVFLDQFVRLVKTA